MIASLVIALIGLAFSWLIGSQGAHYLGLPVIFIAAMVAFAMNWLAFIPAWLARTEKFYDLVGALSYLSVVVVALVLSNPPTLATFLVACMVSAWCVRLGTMLFARVLRTGEDKRFRPFKESVSRFFTVWTTQGLWVVITMAGALVILTDNNTRGFDAFFLAGAALWATGFLIEAIADRQKSVFRQTPGNEGKFISTGLWRYSQHPNYFGEILLWTGIAIIALPQLQGWSYLALLSPLFVYVLVVHISGINLLDAAAKERWGDDADYQRYVRSTAKLALLPPKHR